jgi:hypothetical protein
MIKILFLSDIVGKIGRKAVVEYLPKLIKQYEPDLVIANAENLAHGIGFTNSTLEEIKEAGVHICTSGNHAWKKAGSDEILNLNNPYVIRPANYPSKKSGKGYKAIEIGKNNIIVVNLLGKVYIDEEEVDSPFKVMERILKKLDKHDIVLVDFHAEATSEKTAFANYFDGQVSAVLGTHTHVQTADERILEKGTVFITDVGMTGYYDSIIGSDKNQIFNLFLGQGKSSKRHDLPDKGKVLFNGAYLEINAKTGKAHKIERIYKSFTINK